MDAPVTYSPRSRAQQLRMLARANRENREQTLMERRDAWDDGGRGMFLAYRQDRRLMALGAEKRRLQRLVYREGVPEGREVIRRSDGMLRARSRPRRWRTGS